MLFTILKVGSKVQRYSFGLNCGNIYDDAVTGWCRYCTAKYRWRPWVILWINIKHDFLNIFTSLVILVWWIWKTFIMCAIWYVIALFLHHDWKGRQYYFWEDQYYILQLLQKFIRQMIVEKNEYLVLGKT